MKSKKIIRKYYKNMPKIKKSAEELNKNIKAEPRDVLIDGEDKELDVELIAGSPIVDENADDEDVSSLDDDEIDPFKDKWEE